jgi:hypothetical protein
MDAIEMLEAQHAELEDLFHEMSGARDAATKQLIFEDIAATLSVHKELLARGPWLLAQISQARPSVDRLVAELRQQSVTDRTFDANLMTLQEELECEMDELETALIASPRTSPTSPTTQMFEPAAAAA